MATYYVGWDVGGWHNPKKDGVVILKRKGKDLELSCPPFLGNIAEVLTSEQNNLCTWIREKSTSSDPSDRFIFAIDAILGCPQEACNLWNMSPTKAEANPLFIPNIKSGAKKNLYLHRYTETIFARRPLSVVQDLMGSQSTKALFALRQCNARWCNDFNNNDFGIWLQGNDRFFETYPANAKGSIGEAINSILSKISDESLRENSDIVDAVICAIIASMYETQQLCGPRNYTSNKCDWKKIGYEGWIWLPQTYWESISHCKN